MTEQKTGMVVREKEMMESGELTGEQETCEEASVAVEETRTGVLCDNRGVGVVEVILILVVLIALVLIFKEQLGSMVTKAMEALEKSMNEVLS